MSDKRSEVNVTKELHRIISSSSLHGLRKVEKGSILKNKRFRGTVQDWYGKKAPWPMIESDLILVFEDISKAIDNNLIAAIEIKFFKQSKNLDKQLRQAYREFGQPLRNLMYGFDSVALWHIFDENLDEGKSRDYAAIVGDTITKLKLPVVYLATKITEDRCKIFQPWDIDCNDLDYMLRSLKGLFENKRNPLSQSEIGEYRNALKVTLAIP
jgi:hypothetical protein